MTTGSHIPSPTTAVLWLGPVPVRGYALCILAGIGLAIWICGRRLADRGHDPRAAMDIAYWAVPLGILGGRLYHVVTTPQPYFGEGGRPMDAVKIWNGGLGIWGAVALGAVGAWIGARRAGIPFLDLADSAVPGVAVAQALGRWGNYVNNELYGGRTDVPWALEIHRMDSSGQAVRDAAGRAVVEGYFHPTFLYESLWCLLIAVAMLVIERRRLRAGRPLRRGQVMGLYVLFYPVGRVVVEMMRTDPANHVLGVRLNVWTSLLVLLLGVLLFVRAGRTQPPAPIGAPSHDADPDRP